MAEDRLDRLADRTGDLICDRNRLARMSEAGRGLGRPDAARFVAGRLLELGGEPQ